MKVTVDTTAAPTIPPGTRYGRFTWGWLRRNLQSAGKIARYEITVVESATVPKTRPQNGMFLRLEGKDAGVEPIGQRIIETPESTHDAEFLRNSRSGFIAYVPPGSVKKGHTLVMTGVTAAGDKIAACTVCHGFDLRGLGPVPTLAGRSPSYIVRQLYDMQRGKRNGAWTPLMADVVARLGPDDLLTAAAYLASLKP